MSSRCHICDTAATTGRLAAPERCPKVSLHRSLPCVCPPLEIRLRCTHDTESLACRGLHHPPAVHLLNFLGAERLEPAYFGGDIVGLDVEVDPARVVDLLHFDIESMLHIGEPPVGGVLASRQFVRRHAERVAPEPR